MEWEGKSVGASKEGVAGAARQEIRKEELLLREEVRRAGGLTADEVRRAAAAIEQQEEGSAAHDGESDLALQVGAIHASRGPIVSEDALDASPNEIRAIEDAKQLLWRGPTRDGAPTCPVRPDGQSTVSIMQRAQRLVDGSNRRCEDIGVLVTESPGRYLDMAWNIACLAAAGARTYGQMQGGWTPLMVLCWSGHAGHPLLLAALLNATGPASAAIDAQVCLPTLQNPVHLLFQAVTPTTAGTPGLDGALGPSVALLLQEGGLDACLGQDAKGQTPLHTVGDSVALSLIALQSELKLFREVRGFRRVRAAVGMAAAGGEMAEVSGGYCHGHPRGDPGDFYLRTRDSKGHLPAECSAGISWRCLQVHAAISRSGFRAADWISNKMRASLAVHGGRATDSSLDGGATSSSSIRDEMRGAFEGRAHREMPVSAILMHACSYRTYLNRDEDFGYRLHEALTFMKAYVPGGSDYQLLVPRAERLARQAALAGAEHLDEVPRLEQQAALARDGQARDIESLMAPRFSAVSAAREDMPFWHPERATMFFEEGRFPWYALRATIRGSFQYFMPFIDAAGHDSDPDAKARGSEVHLRAGFLAACGESFEAVADLVRRRDQHGFAEVNHIDYVLERLQFRKMAPPGLAQLSLACAGWLLMRCQWSPRKLWMVEWRSGSGQARRRKAMAVVKQALSSKAQ